MKDFNAWQIEYDFILSEYNKAFDRVTHCPESELKKAKESLAFWRHKWFNH